MCLAIPAKITEIGDDGLAVADMLGVSRAVSLDLTPHAGIGDYVLVHAGFAIEVVDEAFATETIELMRQMPELVADDLGPANDASGAPDTTANAANAANAGTRA